jgi:hypothetical protein
VSWLIASPEVFELRQQASLEKWVRLGIRKHGGYSIKQPHTPGLISERVGRCPIPTDGRFERSGMRTIEVFAALDAGPTFGAVCHESISNQAGIGNKDTRR